jgi:hypothetical protein
MFIKYVAFYTFSEFILPHIVKSFSYIIGKYVENYKNFEYYYLDFPRM